MRYVELLTGVAGVALRNAQLYREKKELSLALAAERGQLFQVLEELPDGVVVLFGSEGFAKGKARQALSVGSTVSLEDLPAALEPAWEGGRLGFSLGGATV